MQSKLSKSTQKVLLSIKIPALARRMSSLQSVATRCVLFYQLMYDVTCPSAGLLLQSSRRTPRISRHECRRTKKTSSLQKSGSCQVLSTLAPSSLTHWDGDRKTPGCGFWSLRTSAPGSMAPRRPCFAQEFQALARQSFATVVDFAADSMSAGDTALAHYFCNFKEKEA